MLQKAVVGCVFAAASASLAIEAPVGGDVTFRDGVSLIDATDGLFDTAGGFNGPTVGGDGPLAGRTPVVVVRGGPETLGREENGVSPVATPLPTPGLAAGVGLLLVGARRRR